MAGISSGILQPVEYSAVQQSERHGWKPGVRAHYIGWVSNLIAKDLETDSVGIEGDLLTVRAVYECVNELNCERIPPLPLGEGRVRVSGFV